MSESCRGREDEIPLARGRTLDEYLQKLSPEGRETIRQTLEAIASTRKSDKVAPSIINTLSGKLNRYPVSVVLRACRIYLDQDHASQGKGEAYLLGIVRGEAKRQNGNREEGEVPAPPLPPGVPYPKPTTDGQRAMNRAWLDQQAEREQGR